MSVRNILDGTITVEGGGGGEMPDNPEVETLTATDSITTNNLTATGDITSKNITVTQGLIVDNTFVLAQREADNNKNIAITYSDGSEGTLTALVHSKVCNLNSLQHVLTCQTSLSSLSKAIKQVVIPTGLDFTGRQTESHNETAAQLMEQTCFWVWFTSMWKTTS